MSTPARTLDREVGVMDSTPGLDLSPAIDCAFLLRLLSKANPGGHHMGAVKPNKFTFLASVKAEEEEVPGFRYRFFKDRLGPKSVGVYTDLGRLVGAGMLKSDGALAAKGETALRSIDDFFRSEAGFTGIVDAVAREYGRLSRPALVDRVHSMTVAVKGQNVSIDAAPPGALLFEPANPRHVSADDSWAETIDLMLDPQVDSALGGSREDVISGRVRPFSPYA